MTARMPSKQVHLFDAANDYELVLTTLQKLTYGDVDYSDIANVFDIKHKINPTFNAFISETYYWRKLEKN